MLQMPFHLARQTLYLKSLEGILLIRIWLPCALSTIIVPNKAPLGLHGVAKDMRKEDSSEHAELWNIPVVFQCSSLSILMRQWLMRHGQTNGFFTGKICHLLCWEFCLSQEHWKSPGEPENKIFAFHGSRSKNGADQSFLHQPASPLGLQTARRNAWLL